jgi:hypothetical protein
MATVQKIRISKGGEFELAKAYYSILFILNDIKVTKTELNLIAYCAVNGTISTPPIREEFMREFDVPNGSLNNMIARLQQDDVRIFVKENKKIRIHPAIRMNFKDDILLQLYLRNNESEND